MARTNNNRPRRDVDASTPAPSSSTTPLLSTNTGAQTLTHITMSAQKRTSITRSQSTAGGSTTSPTASAASANPTLSRPLLTRANKTTPSIPTLGSAKPKTQTRPSLLKRITMQVDDALELSGPSTSTHRNIPPRPSHWTDHAHRSALLQTWDNIHEDAASSKSKYPRSVVGQLVAAEKSLILQFQELGEGEIPLGREWMEYVLGVSLRHPFCAEGRSMGRWEILSGVGRVGGARAWGPW